MWLLSIQISKIINSKVFLMWEKSYVFILHYQWNKMKCYQDLKKGLWTECTQNSPFNKKRSKKKSKFPEGQIQKIEMALPTVPCLEQGFCTRPCKVSKAEATHHAFPDSWPCHSRNQEALTCRLLMWSKALRTHFCPGWTSRATSLQAASKNCHTENQ